MAKKKRRSPRKRATNLQQAEEQLARFSRLLDNWVAKSVDAAKKVETYRKKTTYYQERVDQLRREAAVEAARIAEQMGREQRSIDLDGGDG